MLERLAVNLHKRRIYSKIRRVKGLIKKNKLKLAEKKYCELLDHYHHFCRKATYLEKLSTYHNLLYLYHELERRKKVKDHEPPKVMTKAEAAKREAEEKKAGEEARKKAEEGLAKGEAEKKPAQAEERIGKAASPLQSEKPKPAAVSAKGGIRTALDDLYAYVQEKGNVDINKAALKFNVSRGRIEEWAKILEEHELVRIYYPAFTTPELRSLEWIKKMEEARRRKREERMGNKKKGQK